MLVNQVLVLEKRYITSHATQGSNLGSGKRQQVVQLALLNLLIWIWFYVVKSVML